MTLPSCSQDTGTLVEVCREFGARGWCRATSGNFSLRADDTHCLITQSGKDKSRLAHTDLMLCDLQGQPVDTTQRPSAETPIHVRLYQLDKSIGAVLHTHSICSTLLSRHSGSELVFSGLEMQKALRGVTSHTEEVVVPIFDNNQDTRTLADVVADAWSGNASSSHGFLIRGHGLYAWGADANEARRHVEGLEFLFECRWQEKLAGLL